MGSINKKQTTKKEVFRDFLLLIFYAAVSVVSAIYDWIPVSYVATFGAGTQLILFIKSYEEL